MAARVNTVAFLGFQVLDVEVQVHMSAGLPAFTRVGIPSVLCSVRTPRSAFSYKRTLGAPFRHPLDFFRVPISRHGELPSGAEFQRGPFIAARLVRSA